ncbi:hypothetical protein CSB11_02490 [Candidatus Campbellbacteria bacterium]|nr:MAG: hypothetical protein CSB11_02490 [Candidatus Campbellbacteria bacterium]
MNKKQIILAIFLVLVLTMFFFVNKKENIEIQNTQNTKIEKQENKTEQEFIKEIKYSNLMGEEVEKDLKDELQKVGVSDEVVNKFMNDVSLYNKFIGLKLGGTLNTKGFETIDKLKPDYDLTNIDQIWNNYDQNDPGQNCRITSFRLFEDFVEIQDPKKEYSRFMFIDEESLKYNKEKIGYKNLDKFKTLFSSIPTELVKDQKVHVQKIENYFKERKVQFKKSDKISLISVWMHSDLDNELFVGHTGILLQKNDGKFWFIEKVSFQEPYQLVEFKNKLELNDYLMGLYDTSWGQPTARPMIFENDHLIENFRLNPGTTKKDQEQK